MKHINKISVESFKNSFNDPNKPFRYAVLDNFLKKEVCDELAESYPPIDSPVWYKFRDELHGEKNVFEKGMLGISNIEELPEIAFKVIQELNSREFVEILRKITDIEELKNDVYNNIGQWAGIRAMTPGGYQAIHSDARKHPHLGVEKRITLVGYLNKNWEPSHKGVTEIWNDDMTECVDSVDPVYNRILIFENTEKSHHGVPEVNEYRKTFLTSYLLDSKDFKETRSKARFMKRPNEKDVEIWDKLSAIRENLKDF
jgi:hypothetical protein